MEGAVIFERFLLFITIHLLKHIKFLQGTREWKINNAVCCLLTERNEEKAECDVSVFSLCRADCN